MADGELTREVRIGTEAFVLFGSLPDPDTLELELWGSERELWRGSTTSEFVGRTLAAVGATAAITAEMFAQLVFVPASEIPFPVELTLTTLDELRMSSPAKKRGKTIGGGGGGGGGPGAAIIAADRFLIVAFELDDIRVRCPVRLSAVALRANWREDAGEGSGGEPLEPEYAAPPRVTFANDGGVKQRNGSSKKDSSSSSTSVVQNLHRKLSGLSRRNQAHDWDRASAAAAATKSPLRKKSFGVPDRISKKAPAVAVNGNEAASRRGISEGGPEAAARREPQQRQQPAADNNTATANNSRSTKKLMEAYARLRQVNAKLCDDLARMRLDLETRQMQLEEEAVTNTRLREENMLLREALRESQEAELANLTKAKRARAEVKELRKYARQASDELEFAVAQHAQAIAEKEHDMMMLLDHYDKVSSRAATTRTARHGVSRGITREGEEKRSPSDPMHAEGVARTYSGSDRHGRRRTTRARSLSEDPGQRRRRREPSPSDRLYADPEPGYAEVFREQGDAHRRHGSERRGRRRRDEASGSPPRTRRRRGEWTPTGSRESSRSPVRTNARTRGGRNVAPSPDDWRRDDRPRRAVSRTRSPAPSRSPSPEALRLGRSVSSQRIEDSPPRSRKPAGSRAVYSASPISEAPPAVNQYRKGSTSRRSASRSRSPSGESKRRDPREEQRRSLGGAEGHRSARHEPRERSPVQRGRERERRSLSRGIEKIRRPRSASSSLGRRFDPTAYVEEQRQKRGASVEPASSRETRGIPRGARARSVSPGPWY